MPKKKSWQDKLNNSTDLPKKVEMDGKIAERFGPGFMVIPSPKDVDAIMKKVLKGKLITVKEIREKLAKDFDADITCPLTTGIFTWISANAAEEAAAEGKVDITPYWRTLKSDGVLNEKYPFGPEHQKSLLEAEGHKVIQKGKKYVVDNFEKSLAKL
ncbi:MAG: MGMT family protein [Actinomycetota bacterium]|nr:MGMT family protein [Actinomycetota bacterium]